MSSGKKFFKENKGIKKSCKSVQDWQDFSIIFQTIHFLDIVNIEIKNKISILLYHSF